MSPRQIKHRKRMQAIYQRRYRKKLRQRGLTIRRTPRKTHDHGLPRATDAETRSANDHARYVFRRERLYDQCLTARGTPRQKFSLLTPGELRERDILRKRARRQNLWAQGLTSHGTPRKNGIMPTLPEAEREWREFRASMTLPVSQDWTEYTTPLERAA